MAAAPPRQRERRLSQDLKDNPDEGTHVCLGEGIRLLDVALMRVFAAFDAMIRLASPAGLRLSGRMP